MWSTLLATDAAVSQWWHAHQLPWLTAAMLLVSELHTTLALYLATGLLAAWLLGRQQGRWVPALVLCVPGGLLLNGTLKHLFQRARPLWEDPLVVLHSYSFPSGHANGATVFWGFVAFWWVSTHAPRPAARRAAWALAGLMVLVVAFSRVYLGVHYLTDVTAGMLEGSLWLVLTMRMTRGLRRPAGGGTIAG